MKIVRISDEAHKLVMDRADGRPFHLMLDRLLLESPKKAEPKRQNPQLKKKPTHPAFQKMKDIYCETWQKNNRFEYQWNGAIDASALNRMIKNLENINESEQSIIDFFALIMDKLPNFWKDKTINALNKNLNGIIADIKNGGNKDTKVQNGGIFDFRN